MKRLQVFLILWSATWGPLMGQQVLQVYPGDVTNNGVVNNLDFLHLGLAYNFAGPARDSSALDFAPKVASPWSYQFPGGLNMAYADCNGDGVVNYFFDAFPLYTNYGLQRDSNVMQDVFVPGLQGVDAPLRFDHAAVPGVVHPGQTIRIPIELGSMEIPAEDYYGVAFSVFANGAGIDFNQTEFSFAETSWANPDNDRIWMSKKAAPNRKDVGVVRTDRNQKRGYGRIGYADFVIIVDVIGLQSIPVSIGQVKMMDKFGNYSTVAGDTIWLNVAPVSVSSNDELKKGPEIAVSPNPAQDYLLIQSDENILGLSLSDMLGRTLLEEHHMRGRSAALNLPKTPPGIYLLRVETARGTAVRRIQIQP